MRVRPHGRWTRTALATACLIAAFGSPCLARETPTPPPGGFVRHDVEELLRDLGSDDPRVAAWAAHHAGRERVETAVPALLSQLRAQAALEETSRSFALQAAVLDALILLDPVIDADVLLPHARGRLLDSVAVFLARHPERYGRTCLSLFASLKYGDREWLALGNAMVSAGTPGFAACLLRDLELRMKVRVWNEVPLNFREPGGSVPGCGYQTIPEDYPPTVLYRLRNRPEDGAVLFAPGPRSIYFTRWKYEQRDIWTCSSLYLEPPRDECRLEWLASFNARPWRLVARSEVDLRWTGDPPYLREVVRLRAALAGA